MRWIPVKGWTMHVFLLDSLPFFISLSLIRLPLTPANHSLLSIQFQRSVSVVPRFSRSVQRFSLPCFQFITLASITLRSRFRYPVVFMSSPSIPPRFSTSSR
jgi:hypothetical protein